MRFADDAKCIEWGVDWITVTAKDRESRELLLREGKQLLDEAAAAGDDVSAFRWKGYEGWTTGGCDVANRDDSAMVRLHGMTARDDWWEVAQFAQNCSRIDFQLTFRSEVESVDRTLARAWRAATRKKLYGKPLEWHYRRDSKKGNTLELGRRASDKFGRIYDKGKESKLDHYKGCTRLEVEFKGDAAWSRLKALSGINSPHDIIPSEVCAFFLLRGVDCRLERDVLPLLKVARRVTDIDNFRMYLIKCVQPGVRRLVEKRGLDVALEALGLASMVQPAASGLTKMDQRKDGRDARSHLESKIIRNADEPAT